MPVNKSAVHATINAPTLATFPNRAPALPPALGDLRFRQLLGSTAWHILPAAIRQRFSKRLEDGRTVVYIGRTTHMRMNHAGFILAQLARIIGGPLPISRDVDVPSIVTVTEDIATGGQIWTRLYAHRNGFPQVIYSSKRFAGPTGLEEHVGCGIGMSLKLTARSTALTFESERYFLQLGPLRFYIPRWLAPGQLTIGHHEIDPHRVAFTLDLKHALFGQLIQQRAEFEEAH